MATMEFNTDNVLLLKTYADKAYDSLTPTIGTVTLEVGSALAYGAIIGAILKKVHPAVGLASAIYEAAKEYTSSLTIAQKKKYKDLYNSTYVLMTSNGNQYTRVRMEGNFVSVKVKSKEDGKIYDVPVITGYPRVTGYRTKTGEWILAS